MKEIPLSRGMVAVVDDGDYSRIDDRPWYASKRKHTWYAVDCNGNFMHRLIMRAQDGQKVDHRDGNGLDNQRSNLRLCTQAQNNTNAGRRSSNRSGFKGVHWYAQTGKWRVQCKHRHVGTFDTAEEAARAYDAAAINQFGEFARLNFPQQPAAPSAA